MSVNAHMRRAQLRASRIVVADVAPDDLHLRARVSFPSFCEAFGKVNQEHHKLWIDQFITEKNSSQLLRIAGPNTSILAPRGPLALQTLVATPQGWRELGDLQVGQLVMADDGVPTQVLAVTDYLDPTETYAVIFCDDTRIVCDDSHRWDVREHGDPAGSYRTLTLQQIRLGLALSPGRKHKPELPWLNSRGRAIYTLPPAGAVAYQPAALPVEPYLLGLLLPGGGLTQDTPRLVKPADGVRRRVEPLLPLGITLERATKQPGVYYLTGGVQGQRNPLTEALRELGLHGTRRPQRFIPRAYLLGSIRQRDDLLQGLLEAGGAHSRRGMVFKTASLALATGVAELVRSLGGYAKLAVVRPGGRPVRFRVEIKLPSSGSCARTIRDIIPVKSQPTRCITIDHPSERFLAQDYCVVKNSAKSTVLGMMCAWAIGLHAMEGQMLRMLYLGYSLDIARSRSHVIKNIIASKVYQLIFPRLRLSKTRQSDELWAIDFDHAGIDPGADDPYTLVAQGLSGSIVSRRSQLIVLDDVIKSSESIANPRIRQQMMTNWSEVVRPTMLEGGRVFNLGTRFTSNDIHATRFNADNGWNVITQQAIIKDDNGLERSYWPGWFSLDYLRKLRDEDPIAFSFQFQNQPASASSIDFPKEWLVTDDIIGSYDVLAVGIDLSSGKKERNDFTVFTLAGLAGDRMDVIDYRRVRIMGNLEKIQAMLELLEDWSIILRNGEHPDGAPRYVATGSEVTCWAESIAYQQSFKGDAKTIIYAKQQLANVHIRGVDSYRGDKLMRFRGSFGMFQLGRIRWNRYINWDPYWNELLNIDTGAEHDDCVDSFMLAHRGCVGAGSYQTLWGKWETERGEPLRDLAPAG